MKIGEYEFPDFDGLYNDAGAGHFTWFWMDQSSNEDFSNTGNEELWLDCPDTEGWIHFRYDGEKLVWGECGDTNELAKQYYPVGKATPKTIIRMVTAKKLEII